MGGAYLPITLSRLYISSNNDIAFATCTVLPDNSNVKSSGSLALDTLNSLNEENVAMFVGSCYEFLTHLFRFLNSCYFVICCCCVCRCVCVCVGNRIARVCTLLGFKFV